MQHEKYSLTWNAYSDHLKSMMKELMMNEDFSDVTLVTEDKKHIMANMNILSACSPVFKDILKRNLIENTGIYMRQMQYSLKTYQDCIRKGILSLTYNIQIMTHFIKDKNM